MKSVRLLDQLRERIRLLHYSLRTEEAYVYWARAFIRFHGLRHPAEMGKTEVEGFLMHLAAQKGLSASTHRQALSALIFLYDKVLGLQLPWLADICWPAGEAIQAGSFCSSLSPRALTVQRPTRSPFAHRASVWMCNGALSGAQFQAHGRASSEQLLHAQLLGMTFQVRQPVLAQADLRCRLSGWPNRR